VLLGRIHIRKSAVRDRSGVCMIPWGLPAEVIGDSRSLAYVCCLDAPAVRRWSSQFLMPSNFPSLL